MFDLKGALSIFHQLFYDRILVIYDIGEAIEINTQNLQTNLKFLLNQETKILQASMSPNENNLLLLSQNGQIFLFNKMLELEKTYELFKEENNNEEINEIIQGQFSWRIDSLFFSIVFQTKDGTKSMTFSNDLQTFLSPSIYNPEYPLVINYFEKFNPEILPLCAWASNGSLITSVKIKGNDKFIVLWEKNVLFYEEFQLDLEKNFQIINIFWHPSENILFVLSEKEKESNILIYLKSNGHWNLKNTLNQITKIIFCTFNGKNLIIFLSSGQILELQFYFNNDIYSYQRNGNLEEGLGIMIQSNILSITPYDKFVIPPPMSLCQLEHKNKILDFDFIDNNLFFIDNELNLFQSFYSFPNKIQTEQFLQNLKDYSFIRNLKIIKLNENEFQGFFIETKKEENYQNFIIIFSVDIQQKSFKLLNKISIEEDKIIDSIFKLNKNVYFMINFNQIHKWNEDLEDLEFCFDINLNDEDQIEKWVLFYNQEYHDQDQLPSIFYLNQNDSLFFNDIKIAEDCTSFLIYKKYIFFTCASSTPYDHLYCCSLEQIEKNIYEKPTPNLNAVSENYQKRNIEKNSTLLCCSLTQILLQLPRGNLEGFHHRILLLEEIYRLTKEQKYFEGFILIRKNKLNSNLIIDLNFQQFIDYIINGKFLTDFNSKFIDQFILDLKDDFSEELKFILKSDQLLKLQQEINDKIQNINKTNFLLEIMEKEMMKNKNQFIFNIMVIYSKKTPPELAKGLQLIKSIKDQQHSLEEYRNPAPHLKSQKESFSLNYKKVLKCFSWLVNAQELYELSLDIYDLELALMVAEFTQKDPKEYIPFIQHLKSIQNEIEFKSTIQLHLQNYSETIKQLSQGNEQQQNEAIQLIKEKNCFLDGLKFFSHNKEQQELIKKFYGEYLFQKKDYKNAAVFLQPYDDKKNIVLQCYEKTLDIENGYQFLILKQFSEEEKNKFVKILSQKFLKLKAYENLIKLIDLDKGNISQKLIYQLKGKLFRDSKQTFLNNFHFFSYQEQTNVIKEILLAQSIERNLLEEKIINYQKWKKRLKIVQERKTKNKEQGVDDDALTMMSDTSSFQSNITGMSADDFSLISGMSKLGIKKSKKPKNLHQRKYKENSVYEEEWLTESLNILDISPEEEKNIEHLLGLLIQANEIDAMKELFKTFKELCKILNHKTFYKTQAQQEFEKKNPEVFELYNHVKDFDHKIIDTKKDKKFDILKKYEELLQIIYSQELQNR